LHKSFARIIIFLGYFNLLCTAEEAAQSDLYLSWTMNI